MFCKNCGKELTEDVKFCPVCGEKQAAEVNSEENPAQQFANQYISFGEPVKASEPKKSSKGPLIVVGVIALVLVAAVAVLIGSLFGGGVKSEVRTAFKNTWIALMKEQDANLTAIMESDTYRVDYSLAVDRLDITDYYGDTTAIADMLGQMRMRISSTVSSDAEEIDCTLTAGVGNMNDIQLEFLFTDDNYYVGLPQLYERYFYLSQKEVDAITEIEISEAFNQKETEEAVKSIGKTFSIAFSEIFEKATCTKTEKITLKGNADIQVQEVEISLPVADYETFIQGIPSLIESDKVFMNWLISLTSEEEADDFLESLRYELEGFTYGDDTASDVILCYAYMNNKKQIVQIRIPFGEEDEKSEMVLALLGEKELTDYIEFSITSDDYYSEHVISLIQKKDGEAYDVTIRLTEDGTDLLLVEVAGAYRSEKGRVTCTYDTFDIVYDDGYSRYESSMSGVYTVSKAEKKIRSLADAINIITISEEEGIEVLSVIFSNVKEGGYIPSEYMEGLDALMSELLGGSYSGAELPVEGAFSG